MLKSARIFSISCCSLISSSRISLFSFTIAAGSIKRVEPVEDWSCNIPLNEERYSALTGRQYLPLRIVIIASCSILRLLPFNMLPSCSCILSPAALSLRLACARPGLASSAISSSARIQRLISCISMERGSISWYLSFNESPVSSEPLRLWRKKALTLPAVFRSEDIASSSPVPSTEPISRRFRLPRISEMPLKDISPCVSMWVSASDVSRCAASIHSLSLCGRRLWQYSFPSGERASASSIFIILSYSKVCKVLLFIRTPPFLKIYGNIIH